jgi:hypothetical protein
VARVERNLATRVALGAGAAGAATALSMPAAGALGTFGPKALVTVALLGGLGGGAWLGVRQLGPQATDAPTPAVPRGTSRVTAQPAAPTPAPSRPALDGDARDVTEPPPSPLATAVVPSKRPLAPVAPATSPAATHPAVVPERAPAVSPHAATEAPESTNAAGAFPVTEATRPPEPLAPSRPVDPLQAEAAALRAAQGALRAGDARKALTLLAAQDRQFATGALQEERAAARVLARCQAYGPEGVAGEAARFEQRYPRSALLGRVRAACRER